MVGDCGDFGHLQAADRIALILTGISGNLRGRSRPTVRWGLLDTADRGKKSRRPRSCALEFGLSGSMVFGGWLSRPHPICTKA
jgi:hypothetical protein